MKYYTKGNKRANIIITANPTKAITTIIAEDNLNVSPSVIPLILLMTQKPLSFIQAMGFEPHPMARARYNG